MDSPAVTIDVKTPGNLAFKTARQRLGLAQIPLAMAASTSETMINKIEVHGYVPSYPIRRRLARALGVTMHTLWPDVNDEDWQPDPLDQSSAHGA